MIVGKNKCCVLRLTTTVLTAGILVLAANTAQAALYYWDATGTATWDSTANWWTTSAGSTNPSGLPGSGDSVVFNGAGVAGAETVQLGSSYGITGGTFANTGTTLLESLSTTANTLTIGTGGITISSGAGAVTLGNATDPMPITLSGTQSWTNNSSNTLTVVDAVSNGGNTLTIAGGGVTLSDALSGAGGLAMTGSGTLALSGDNPYSGGTTLKSGTLVVGSATALGTGTLTISGGTLDSGAANLVNANNNPQNWTTGSIYFLGTGGNSLDLGSGAVTPSAPPTVTVNAGTLGVGGINASSYTLTKAGTGTLLLHGTTTLANLYVGYNGSANPSAAAGAGTLAIASGGALNVGSGASNNFYVGYGGDQSHGGLGVVDASLAASVNIRVAQVEVGATCGSNGTLKLGASNTITASSEFGVNHGKWGYNNAYGILTTATNGTTTIHTPAMYVGQDEYNGTTGGNGQFTLGSGGTLTVDGVVTGNSSNRTALAIGVYGGWNNINSSPASVMDLTGGGTGLASLTLSRLMIGQMGCSSTGYGELLLSAGAVNHLDIVGSSGTVSVDGQGSPVENVVTIGDVGWEKAGASGGTTGGTLTLGHLDATSQITCTDNSTAILLAEKRNSNGTVTGVLNLGGGSLTITTTSAAIAGGGGNSYVNFNGITLIAGAASQTWIQNLTSGSIASGGVNFDPNGNSVAIPAQVLSGNGPLAVVGGGTLTLGGNNTYTGGTSIANGTLSAANIVVGSNASNLGDATSAIVLGDNAGDSGTLNYTGNTASFTRGFTVNSGGGQILNNAPTGQSLTIATGAITGSGPLTIGGSASTTVTSPIPSSIASVAASGGTVTLAAQNTYTGGTSVTAGTLFLNNTNSTGSVYVGTGAVLAGSGAASSATATVNGTIDTTPYPTHPLTVGGLTLNGGAAINIGALSTYISSPALNVTGLLTLPSSGSATINANLGATGSLAAGTYELAGYNSISSTTILPFTLSVTNLGGETASLSASGGYLDLIVSGGVPYWNGAQTDWSSTSAWTLQPGGTLETFTTGDGDTFDSANNTGGNWNIALNQGNVQPGSVTFANTAGTSYTLSGSCSIAGSAKLSVNGGGSVTINNSNTYTGGTILSDGLLNVGNAAALGSGTLSISGGSLDNTTGGSLTLANNLPQTWTNGFTFVGTNPLNLGTGPVTLGNATTVTVSASTLTVDGNISGALQSLTKNGNATLTLAGTNSYSGGTTVAGGVLQLAAAGALPTSGNLAVASGGTLDLDGQVVAVAATIGGSGVIANSSGTAVLALSGASVTVNPTLAEMGGTLAVSVSGAGTSLTLNGANSYSGGTTLTNGLLNLGNAAALGSGTLTVSGGSLDNTNGSMTLANNISQNWNGSFTFVGSNPLNLGTGPVSLGASPTLTVSASTLTVGGNISGTSYGVTKSGSGELVLSGNNSTYGGGTTLANGVLVLGGSGALGTGTFTISGGTLDSAAASVVNANNNPQTWTTGSIYFLGTGGSSLDLGSGAVTVSSDPTVTVVNAGATLGVGGISSSYTLTKAGAGTLLLHGATTLGNLSIGVNSNGGSLVIGNGGSLSVGSGPANNFYVGYSGGYTGVVDASQTSAFTANVGTFCIGVTNGTSNNCIGTLKLGASNTITASSAVSIGGQSPGGGSTSQGNAGTVTIPVASTTTIHTPTMWLADATGNGTTTGNATLTLGSGGTFTLDGVVAGNSSGQAALLIANGGGQYSPTAYGNMDLSQGVASLTLSSLAVGFVNGPGTSSGTLTLGTSSANHLAVSGTGNVVQIGSYGNWATSSNGTGNGTVSLGNLDATSSITSTNNSTAILLAAKSGTGNSTGTLNLNGGSLTITTTGAAIAGGGGNSSVNFNGITLIAGASSTNWIQNLTSGSIGAGGVTFSPNGNSITIPQVLSGTGPLAVVGGGTLTLSGSNTYSGSTTANNSTLLLSGTLANTAGVALTGGASLTVSGAIGSGTVNVGSNAALTINSGGTVGNGGLTASNNATVTVSGGLGGAVSLGSGASLTVNSGGYVNGGSGINVTGATLSVSGSVGNAAISVGNGGLMTVGAGGTVGNGDVTVGAGTLSVAGSLGSGTVNVNGGAFLTGSGTIGGPVNVAAGFSAANQGAINLADGTIDTLTLTNSGTALTLGAASGTANLNLDLGSSSGISDQLVLTAGSLNVVGPTAINFTELGMLTTGTYNLITFASASGASNLYIGSLSLAPSLTDTLQVTGGTEQLIIGVGIPATAYWQGVSGTNWSNLANWTNDSTGNSPVVNLPGSITNLNFATAGGTATVDQPFAVNSLDLSAGTAVTINGTGTLTLLSSAGLSDTGAAAHTIAAPVALAVPQTWNIQGTSPLTIRGVISTSSSATGATGLILSGGGTVVFSNTNTYYGGTTVAAATTLQLGDGQTNNGSVTGNIADDGLLVFANPNAQSFSGTISGGGSVAANGAGTLTFNTAHTYTGGTTVGANATLQLGDGQNSNGSVSGNIADNGLLLFANPTTQSFTGTISGSGGVAANGPATLTFTVSHNYTGGATVSNGGTLNYGVANALPTTGAVVVNGGQLNLNGQGPSTVGTVTLASGSIVGTSIDSLTGASFNVQSGTVGVVLAGATAGLTKSGAGTVVLTTTNAYGGLTSIQQGTLQCNANAIPGDVQIGQSGTGATLDLETNLANVGTVTLVNGTITSGDNSTLCGFAYNVQSGTVDVTLGDQTDTPLLKTGPGTVVLSATDNSYKGGTSVEGGVLAIGAAAGLGIGNLTLGAGTLQTTGSYALDAGTVTLTGAAAAIDVSGFNDTLTLAGLVTGSGGLTLTGPGRLVLANTAGNTYNGDTNVTTGTLLAEADNALSPNSNLVIGDGASVILDFGAGGSGDALPGFAAPLPAAAASTPVPALAPGGVATVPEPGALALLLAGVLASVGLLLRRQSK